MGDIGLCANALFQKVFEDYQKGYQILHPDRGGSL